MEIIDNEFDIPEPKPLDNLEAFLCIGNAQYFLDEHYREITKSRIHKMGTFILDELKASPYLWPPGFFFFW
jgi:hypothetical protein